jgi:hypothetical protein
LAQRVGAQLVARAGLPDPFSVSNRGQRQASGDCGARCARDAPVRFLLVVQAGVRLGAKPFGGSRRDRFQLGRERLIGGRVCGHSGSFQIEKRFCRAMMSADTATSTINFQRD